MKNNFWFWISIILLLTLAGNFVGYRVLNSQKEQIHQLEMEKVRLEKDIEYLSKPKSPAEPTTEVGKYIGWASWYGEAKSECLGCREDLLTFSGEKFDETALTLASNELPMQTMVEITNLSNNRKTLARVNDTGGFTELGRIADLSKATKEAIDCSDLCLVRLEVR